jgi:hypothetical protein
MIDPNDIGYSQPFKLFELANKKQLIKGEIYYIKDPMKYKNDYWRYYAIFKHYEEAETKTSYAYFKYANSKTKFSFKQYLSPTIIYRRVNDEEYYSKLKEKYDDKCLNIVLKRLVDESFQW